MTMSHILPTNLSGLRVTATCLHAKLLSWNNYRHGFELVVGREL